MRTLPRAPRQRPASAPAATRSALPGNDTANGWLSMLGWDAMRTAQTRFRGLCRINHPITMPANAAAIITIQIGASASPMA